ncbi:branched-chain alpha-keto acid dehydrogenase subunit E2 [Sphingomonas sp. Leaf24]|uniref:pyruvate dehydrogenase complex dihydrolipoamide acetyltransferase n=1 Tax=unclassified Sphingomonas TaxID=196159 RepID=UPI0006FA2488|nr:MULTISPECIES: pyruvate dehydrogenase complex dihydrolipoamide acetyltransferase [unclassified Sphingomonas]KQM13116.1 branched-chain alpha-keto acid dehydrogenase subunit E2 [Sphingomonas sp. Leaf5]KQM85702.1 branched-chain alpha-keto acid dehydrogenase subunit E2 [Sphingomonas sp. Leaf24]KQM95204.1 branched-chain alpha-keto acid dehydrogenase subunit E2 [Sphingomonas sp. Leaf22]
MPIEIKMPALSPTMEEGTLAKWLVKEGDTVKSGDIMAEIETDKATMEFEAVDEGTIGKVLIAEGTDNVKVGAVIAILLEEGEDASAIDAAPTKAETPEPADDQFKGKPDPTDPNKTGSEAAPAPAGTSDHGRPAGAGAAQSDGGRVKASPLARRIAADKGLELSGIAGSGPNGRIVKADVENAKPGAASAPKTESAAPAPSAAATPAPVAEAPKPAAVWFDDSIPHTVEKLSNIRKTIARRLTESKQQVPHIYLTVDIRLDALLKLRGDLNKSLDARGVKLSVNDLLIKALGVALENSPKCNVTFLGNEMVQYSRADVSVAVSTPTGLITPIIRDAANKGVAKISTEMKDLGRRAKENKLKPEEYQGGTASLSNMGMFGIKQFEAVINPPQGMILAVGAGEKRPYIVDDALGVATVMTATGSFDHRAIDGADGAEMLKLFKALVESPLGLIA